MTHRITLSLFAAVLLLAVPVAAQKALDDSPLAAYPGFGHEAETDDDRFAREELARENLISRCMERNGFRYTPVTSILLEDFATPSAAIAALRDDPNDRYERGLSDEERILYRTALFGVEDPMSENADHQPDPTEEGVGGCLGEAMRAVPGVFAAKAELQEEHDAMRQAVMTDVRVKTAEREWATCMEGLGEKRDASPRALEKRQDAELGRLIGGTRAELPSRAELAVLGETHRAERNLTMQCARKVGLPAVVARVRVDYEARFVAEHRKTLDRHLARLEAQRPLVEELGGTAP